MTPDEMPTKPTTMTLPDFRARLAAYRAVQQKEGPNLDGPVTDWDKVCVVVDAYIQALENERWRDLARNEAAPHCSDPECDCRSLS
jgi:hypothetical protein